MENFISIYRMLDFWSLLPPSKRLERALFLLIDWEISVKDVTKTQPTKQNSSTRGTEQSDVSKVCIGKSYNFKV